jgi:hypothetical protein
MIEIYALVGFSISSIARQIRIVVVQRDDRKFCMTAPPEAKAAFIELRRNDVDRKTSLVKRILNATPGMRKAA